MVDIEKLAAAIDAGDHGYSIELIFLAGNERQYAVNFMDGSEPLIFDDIDDAHDHGIRHRSIARAKAALVYLQQCRPANLTP